MSEQRRPIELGRSSLGTLPLRDGQGVAYTFTVYPVRALVSARDAVYAFSRLEGIAPVPVLIDAAHSLALRLRGHERLEQAIGLGAVHLLVHVPEPDDPVGHREAAARLAAFHRPALNRGQPRFLPTAPDGSAVPDAAGQRPRP